MAFAAASVAVLLIIQDLAPMIAATLILGLLYSTAGIPGARLVGIVRTMLPVSLLMAGLRAIFYPSGAVLWEWGPLRITAGGLEDGAVLGIRLIAMALAIFLWLFTTKSQAIVRGLTGLGMPFAWGLSLGLALRYVPTIRDTYQTIERAQRARGFVPERLGTMRRAQAMVPSFVALMVSSFRDSERVAHALESRAFGAPGIKRTYLDEMHFRPVDGLYLVVILAGMALAIVVSLR